ncbi:NAD(P)-dependent oxidoreductase [Peribacillus kribbensis]|uniref:NAD(P)-dependent oxidoreductase n=1 Tax=Peribacillus kribbensis TaxID=356658 RepID=UPI0004238FD3|nr:NAD(P)-dependent oxidoreductase [Peribacillus kribbensis]
MQPFIIKIAGQKVVIAGGGKIAARKARVLDGESASITFIAPEFSAEVETLSKEKGYTLIQRKAAPQDFSEAFLVILATNDPKANKQLADSLPPRQLVCIADDFENGNVAFPATVRRGSLQIAVTSGGASPKLTRKLKKEFEQQFDQSWEGYTEFLLQCRKVIKGLGLSQEEKQELLWELLEDQYRISESARQIKLRQILNEYK